MALHWRNILVPHDFSAPAARALELAAVEAGAHGAAIVLLHVVEMLPRFGPDTTLILAEPGGTPVGMHTHFRRRAEVELADVGRALAGTAPVRWLVREGVPVEEILAVARDEAIDLIVMGTHGRTGLRHALAGSVAERVVRASPVPVLTTR